MCDLSQRQVAAVLSSLARRRGVRRALRATGETAHMSYTQIRRVRFSKRGWFSVLVVLWLIELGASMVRLRAGAPLQSSAFQAIVLKPSPPEAPFDLRFFSGAVKTNSQGQI